MNPEETFLFVPGESPQKLLVLFSAANADRFSLYKATEHYKEYDKLFIRDPNKKHWYQSGLGPHAPTVDAIAEKISNSKRSADTRIYSAGVSMGGYASLMFSCLCDFHAAMAISPQAKLTRGFFRNPPGSIEVPYPNAAGMMAENSKTQYWVLAGDVDWIDNYSMSLLPAAPNVSAIAFPGLDHTLPITLDKKFSMAKILISFVEDRPMSFGLQEKPFDREQVWLGALREAAGYYYGKKPEKALRILESELEQRPDWAGGHTFVARIHFEAKDMAKAQSHWESALEISPKLTEPHLRLAQMHHENRNVEEARFHYRRLIKLRGRGKKDITAALKELDGMM